jgi:hypothetical protein
MIQLTGAAVDYAISRNPMDAEREYWIGCFSKSCLDGIKRRTRAIRLVVALDVSGSMCDTLTPAKVRNDLFAGCATRPDNLQTEEDLFTLPSKLAVAKGALLALIDNLQGERIFLFHMKK